MPFPRALRYGTVNMSILTAIVEDDATTREILAEWISQAAGFRLGGAWNDVESALAAVAGIHPEVVLMDINLPGMSGVDGVRELKRLLPKTQVVMLTVYEDTDHIYNAL